MSITNAQLQDFLNPGISKMNPGVTVRQYNDLICSTDVIRCARACQK